MQNMKNIKHHGHLQESDTIKSETKGILIPKDFAQPRVTPSIKICPEQLGQMLEVLT